MTPAGGRSCIELMRRSIVPASFSVTLLGASVLLLILQPGTALALGGGGTGGFGGGDGGGGGGDGSFGGGGFFGGGGGGGSEEGPVAFVFAHILILVVLLGLYMYIGGHREWRRGRAERSEPREPFSVAVLARTLRRVLLWPVDLIRERWALRSRIPRTRSAAAEAGLDDPRYEPERVQAYVADLFCAIQAAWSQDDRARLASLVGPDLMVEWEERLRDFALKGWSNEVQVRGPVHVDYVGLRNVADAQERSVTVRVSARVRDVVIDRDGQTIHRRHSLLDTYHICEYWTLTPRADDGWLLASIEQHREGLHELDEPLIPSPWSDTASLRREATLEQARERSVENAEIAGIAGADFAEDARAAALDLSLVDDRFAPRVLAGEVEQAVRAWVEAIDGGDDALAGFAGGEVLNELLYPGDPDRRRRLVVRGLKVESMRILELDARENPPSMLVELRVSGHRYLEDRSTTTVVVGDRSVTTSFAPRWRMELTLDETHPWRIVSVEDQQLAAR